MHCPLLPCRIARLVMTIPSRVVASFEVNPLSPPRAQHGGIAHRTLDTFSPLNFPILRRRYRDKGFQNLLQRRRTLLHTLGTLVRAFSTQLPHDVKIRRDNTAHERIMWRRTSRHERRLLVVACAAAFASNVLVAVHR